MMMVTPGIYDLTLTNILGERNIFLVKENLEFIEDKELEVDWDEKDVENVSIKYLLEGHKATGCFLNLDGVELRLKQDMDSDTKQKSNVSIHGELRPENVVEVKYEIFTKGGFKFIDDKCFGDLISPNGKRTT